VSGAHPLVVFRESTVGWPGLALWASADTSMALLVVDSAKSRVALNDPDILPFFPSTTTACPATDFRSDLISRPRQAIDKWLTSTVMGLFVDLRVSASKSNADRSSTSNANSGTSIVKPGRCETPYLGDGKVTLITNKSFSFRGIQLDGVWGCVTLYLQPVWTSRLRTVIATPWLPSSRSTRQTFAPERASSLR
jgi:hypothetical protein